MSDGEGQKLFLRCKEKRIKPNPCFQKAEGTGSGHVSPEATVACGRVVDSREEHPHKCGWLSQHEVPYSLNIHLRTG